jgi:L-threonylcarbamoyladenylate synthase
MVNKVTWQPLKDQEIDKRYLNYELPKCVSILKNGGVIVFPTETLYGLGADISNGKAIEKVIELKGRPKNMPIAIAVTDIEHVKPLAELSNLARRIIEKCLPKPITILLRAKDDVNPLLTAGSDLIGFRFPEHVATEAIIEDFGPITATSANLHGGEDPVIIEPAIQQFGDKVEIYIDSGSCKYAGPSTVVDASGNTIKIIRYGACTGSELEQCLSIKT